MAAVATSTQHIKPSSFSHPSLESCIASYDHHISSSLDDNFFLAFFFNCQAKDTAIKTVATVETSLAILLANPPN